MEGLDLLIGAFQCSIAFATFSLVLAGDANARVGSTPSKAVENAAGASSIPSLACVRLVHGRIHMKDPRVHGST